MAELTALVPLGDREIEMRAPTDGALVVLARITKTLPTSKIENGDYPPEFISKLVKNLGTIGEIVEAMIVKEEDQDWLDTAMVSGKVNAEEIFDAVRIAGQKINGTGGGAGPAKKAAPVRRRAASRSVAR